MAQVGPARALAALACPMLGAVAFVSPSASPAQPGSAALELRGDAPEPRAAGATPQLPVSAAAAALVAAAGTLAVARPAARRAARPAKVSVRAFESELGVQPPVGYWDPLGLAKDGDADVFYRRRCTEVKHGRVAMWAAMGYIAPEFFRWPGGVALEGPAFASLPNGLSALGKVSGAGWGQMFLFCGFLELYAAKQDPTDPPGKLSGSEAGFGKSYFGALGVFKGDGIEDPEKKKRSLNAELANGRLAMMAIIGMFFQDGLTGSAWGDWATYSDSPLRAEGKLGR